MSPRLDHIVFGASELEAGRAAMTRRLGAPSQGGGAHPGFGTRNALWRLGAAYLEVLAPDPGKPRPEGPRPFGLDPSRLGAEPTPIAWVVACDDLDDRLAACPELGRAIEMRRGALRWRLSRTRTARPAWDGLAPALIEWPRGAHPTDKMDDQGLRLRRLTLRTPRPEALRERLARIGVGDLAEVEVGPPGLACGIETTGGVAWFDGIEAP